MTHKKNTVKGTHVVGVIAVIVLIAMVATVYFANNKPKSPSFIPPGTTLENQRKSPIRIPKQMHPPTRKAPKVPKN